MFSYYRRGTPESKIYCLGGDTTTKLNSYSISKLVYTTLHYTKRNTKIKNLLSRRCVHVCECACVWMCMCLVCVCVRTRACARNPQTNHEVCSTPTNLQLQDADGGGAVQCRMCSLTWECVLSNDRMCSLTIECASQLQDADRGRRGAIQALATTAACPSNALKALPGDTITIHSYSITKLNYATLHWSWWYINYKHSCLPIKCSQSSAWSYYTYTHSCLMLLLYTQLPAHLVPSKLCLVILYL